MSREEKELIKRLNGNIFFDISYCYFDTPFGWPFGGLDLQMPTHGLSLGNMEPPSGNIEIFRNVNKIKQLHPNPFLVSPHK
jgi:hypothetical protein